MERALLASTPTRADLLRFAEAAAGLRGCGVAERPNPDPLRFETEINSFLGWDEKNRPPEPAVLFVGSSSIRMWPSARSFPDCPIVNRGFGGAHTSDVNHFYSDIVPKYSPSAIFFYAGDNDIAAGKSPQQVFEDFKMFMDNVKRDLPDTRLFFLAIKPSTLRWRYWKDMEEVNARVEELAESLEDLEYVDVATPMLGDDGTPRPELFVLDGLHLNEQGYVLWNSIVQSHLSSICQGQEQGHVSVPDRPVR